MFASEPDTTIFAHTLPQRFNVLNTIFGANWQVDERSKAREIVALPVC